MATSASSNKAPFRVVVVGAGVSGCILARMLRGLDGVEVSCLERVSRFDHRSAGTGLNIGPNAATALGRIDPELVGMLDAASLPWSDWTMSLTSGRNLFRVSLDDIAGRTGWRIGWSDLYELLRESCGDAIRYGCQVDVPQIDRSSPGRVSIGWEDSTGRHRIDGVDLVVAADGRFSRTRTALSGTPGIDQLGVSIFRLLVGDTSRGLVQDHGQWFNGPNRLLAFRIKPEHVYIAGTFPIAGEIPDDAKTPEFLRQAYLPDGECAPAVRWMVDRICENAADIHWARMQEQTIRYVEQALPVLYLGDAAHGMIPTLGQGATQAIEDAALAAEYIGDRIASGERNPRAWLDAIEAGRSARMRFVMDFSRDASDTMLPGSDVVGGTLRKMEPGFLDELRKLYRDVHPIAAPDAEHMARTRMTTTASLRPAERSAASLS